MSPEAPPKTTIQPITEATTTPVPKPKKSEVWKAHLTFEQVLPFFTVVTIIFTILGLLFVYHNMVVQEIIIDYTHCRDKFAENKTCSRSVVDPHDPTCYCSIDFQLENDMKAPVNLYYMLTNFYQNHRSFVLSKDFKQLAGELSQDVARECGPYDYTTVNGTIKAIAPCGVIANSMFSDVVNLSMRTPLNLSMPIAATHTNFSNINPATYRAIVPLLRKNLIWSFIKAKFQNPPGDLKKAFENYAKPVSWRQNIWELDLEDVSNNGFENEDFIVWMQPAATPTFRKLYRRVDHTRRGFENGLPRGNYTLNIEYQYPVSVFDGTKSIVISNTGIFGAKDTFCTIFTFVMAFLAFVISSIFRILKFIRDKKIKFMFSLDFFKQ